MGHHLVDHLKRKFNQRPIIWKSLKIQFPSFALPIIALPKFLASYCKKSLRFPSKVSNALVFFPNDRTFNLDLLIPKKKKNHYYRFPKWWMFHWENKKSPTQQSQDKACTDTCADSINLASSTKRPLSTNLGWTPRGWDFWTWDLSTFFNVNPGLITPNGCFLGKVPFI